MTDRKNLLDPNILAKIGNLSLLATTVVEGFIAGLHRSVHRGASVEFSEHRKYMPGDDLRYIDWKIFARTDRFYVRDFREETNLKSYILFDVSRSMDYKSGQLSKLDYGLFLAASLSYLMVRQKDAVGLVLFDSRVQKFIKPASTKIHFHYLINNLQDVKAGGETALEQVLHSLASHIRRRSLIILISDLWNEPEGIMRGLSHFRYRHHEVIVFHVLDRQETDFGFSGSREFVDLETDERILCDALTIAKTYRRQFRELGDFYRKNCFERKIGYVPVPTDKPLDAFLYHYLSTRAKYT